MAAENKIKITLKGINSEVEINLSEITTVEQLKSEIAAKQGYENPSAISLILKGKPLAGPESLEKYGIKENCTIFAVINKEFAGSKKSSSTPQSTPKPQPTPNSRQPMHSQAPMGGIPGGMFPGLGDDSVREMQKKLMDNPEMMQSIMNSPMFKSMLDNPEVINNMLMNNPQLKSYAEKNPQFYQILKDPEMMSNIMKMYSSQAASDQMNYQNDIALRQLDNSGHFPKVESMFNNLNNAFDSWPNPLDTGAPRNSAYSGDQNSTSVPNPWGPPQASANFQSPNSAPLPDHQITNAESTSLMNQLINKPHLFQCVGSLFGEISKFSAYNRRMCALYFAPRSSAPFMNILGQMRVFDGVQGSDSVDTEEFLSEPKIAHYCANICYTMGVICMNDASFYSQFFNVDPNTRFGKIVANVKRGVENSRKPKLNVRNDFSPIVVPKKVEISKESVELLVGMGFKKEKVEEALVKCNNSIELAIDWLTKN